jgi:cytochrome b561
MARRQFERAEKLNERAEAIQARSAQIVTAARRLMMIALPVVGALLVYVSWLLFRR